MYWYCIELIAGKVDKDNITFELEHDARIIARNVGSTAQKVEEMMRYFVDLGLFESSQGTITCLKMARRLDKSMTSNPEMRTIIEKLKSHDSIMTQSEKPMQDKIRLDKKRINTPDSDESKKIPISELIEIYNEVCTLLPKVSSVNSKQKRISYLKARWTESKERQSLDWWKEFFKWCNDHPQLNGTSEGFDWIASLEDLVNPSKFTRLIEKGTL